MIYFFRSRESEVITGKVGPDRAIEILNSQKTSGGTKIPSNISDDPAVSETTETTEETTAATASETTTPVETTVPAEDKLLSISKIKDFTVIPFVNESNNSTYSVCEREQQFHLYGLRRFRIYHLPDPPGESGALHY